MRFDAREVEYDAKKLDRVLACAIRNNAVLKRNTRLKERLNGTLKMVKMQHGPSLPCLPMAAEDEAQYNKE